MGFAIAASVAAVAIFNIQQPNQSPERGQQVIAQSSIATTPPSLAMTLQFATQQKEQTQAQQYRSLDPRLSRYLVNYNEYRVNTGVRSMPPHVRLIANETGIMK